MRRILTTVTGALAMAASLSLPVAAQDRARPAPVVVELPPMDIVGSRQQPGAMYVLSRTEGGYEVTELRTSFVREVVRSTAAEPF